MPEHRNLLWMSGAFPRRVELARTRLAFALAALCLLSLAACNSRPPDTSQTNAPASSTPTPDSFSTPTDTPAGDESNGGYGWTTPGDRRMKLSDYLGQVVVLDFYATWCQPCREEAPHLVALHQRFAPEGLQIVGLNVGGPDDREEVPAYAREFGIQYPLGFPDDGFTEMYLAGNDGIPQAFVFDRRGRLARRFIGYSETMASELERVIQSELAAGAD